METTILNIFWTRSTIGLSEKLNLECGRHGFREMEKQDGKPLASATVSLLLHDMDLNTKSGKTKSGVTMDTATGFSSQCPPTYLTTIDSYSAIDVARGICSRCTVICDKNLSEFAFFT